MKLITADTKVTTLGELADRFDELMFPGGGWRAIGFTLGRGKKKYWYITPAPESGQYRCLPIEEGGKLGWPVYHYPNKKVTIYYVET